MDAPITIYGFKNKETGEILCPRCARRKYKHTLEDQVGLGKLTIIRPGHGGITRLCGGNRCSRIVVER